MKRLQWGVPACKQGRGVFLGILLAIVGTFLFALKSIFIKWAYASGGHADSVLLLRMLLAAPFYAFILYKKTRQKPKEALHLQSILSILGLGFLGYYLASYLDLAGLEHISAQLERLILFTYPTMVAVLAWLFLGEKMNKSLVLALFLSYLGIFCMYFKESLLYVHAQTSLGVVLVFGAALSFSFYVLFAKPFISRYGSTRFISIAMLGSTFFIICHFITFHGWRINAWHLEKLPAKVWLYCSILALFCTVIPSYMITFAIAKIGAIRTTLLGSAGPVFTIVLAVVLLGESFGIWHFAGLMLVLIAVGITTFNKQKKANGDDF